MSGRRDARSAERDEDRLVALDVTSVMLGLLAVSIAAAATILCAGPRDGHHGGAPAAARWPESLPPKGPPPALLGRQIGRVARAEHRHWCELTNLSRRGWRGVEIVLPDGRRLQYLATVRAGLVRVAAGAVPTASAAPAAHVLVERTEWGVGPSGPSHVGLAARVGADRFCYEWARGELASVQCRARR